MSANDKHTTVLLNTRHQHPLLPLRALFAGPGGNPVSKTFTDRFVVGRAPTCDICLPDDGISRQHCEIFPDESDWWIQDLNSSNGTFVDGNKVTRARLGKDTRLEFFANGPTIRLQLDESRISGLASVGAGRSNPQTAGPRGVEGDAAVRLAARRHQVRFWAGMSIMTLLLISALAVIVYQHTQREHGNEVAEQLFIQTKALDLELARLKSEFARRSETPLPASVVRASEQLEAMKERYATLAEERALIGGHRSREDLLIFRVARIFGEYDLNIPDSFVAEVKRYIREWQQSERLATAIDRINQPGRARAVVDALRSRGLPPQFIYLAVQESNFRTDAIGPRTRFGIAKGMWQFIPDTAQRYGLQVGPNRDEPSFDPHDERFDFEKSTNAAADYLNFLFTTEARASGLLVMSAYNWGEGNVERTLGRLSDEPRDYNFWRLIQSQMIPDETYGYVLRIYAAAVIGEDPQLFGFSFDNPLAGI